MTLKNYPQNLHIQKKYNYFSENQKHIEIQDFEPQKMTEPTYV